ncbi:hypothetical protein PILCRDRAFT_801127 [Piloderma croceum F 1598]|uniref:Carboxylesterase type B domain-containing protein n=1 Tax=Piloderma croceum (strain F 1598) TaxID=765440 RepID=A0A0C3BAS0_PILCF|nr:hypothetical protein PILCRDRAFT_801127 [Piloderma croceum F 1598]
MVICWSIAILCAIFTVLVSSSPLQEPGTRLKSRDDSPSVVDLGYATYRGSTDPSTNVTSFLSIRYAAPPTGALRFQAPQAPDNVTGVQDATSFPPQCLQAQSGVSQTNPFVHNTHSRKRQSMPSSEDCLFLDVSVPDIGRAEKLPVVVWIHGGGYESGNATFFPQAALVAVSQNRAIAISIQYRLAAFGFLAGPSVKKRGALNAGLLDQNFALQWVQQYVRTKLLLLFGGDPTKVTIWGQSGKPIDSVWCYIISDLHCAAGVSGLHVLMSKADIRRLDRSRLCAAACRGLSLSFSISIAADPCQ